MPDDPIALGIAIALEAIEEHSAEERYQRPDIVVQLRAARMFMEQLQLLLDTALS